MSGGHAERTVCGAEDVAAPLSRPAASVLVADLLPPAELATP